MATKNTFGQELAALGTILESLAPLDTQQRQFVLDTVVQRLGLSASGPRGGAVAVYRDERNGGNGANAGGGGKAEAPHRSSGGGSMSVKEFLREKKPKSDAQRIAVLAYYLTHYAATESFKLADIIKANEDAGGIKIGNPHRAFDNATRSSSFLTPIAGGAKKITTHGEDVVEALPDQEAVAQVMKENRTGRRKRSAKKGASKRASAAKTRGRGS